MIWFGCITMTLMAVWMVAIAVDIDKNNKKETEYFSEQNAKEKRKEVKYTEEKHKKIKIE